ncbi:MAG: hypothetical protein COW00_07520 [Bdellovibrio sp. CG12_big_fil_rev_8_21_14_0_65_39_13]|nr:MAG: hypothetical protein COW78_10545 [Bdellovibrio sp. CG22_combo_CG10-13_8_21_14_all_39_27]PIQ60219.1 MAG: hypothetical protein COW00_07520 [Bdellovibrio sp. CG12_big_fil_rev_8_21_14_0_65_39_13]PIR35731.1 MAG: hypothetical protein COV37_06920 [Bdellovibrio sp. CG11_big_fil_rev_8_21_14_0_20_39_38]
MDNMRKYLKTGLKVARLTRMFAKAIDLFLVLILSIFFYPVGLILALIYAGVADSLQNGQSVGKRLMGFQVISLEDGKPCTLKQSIIRNLPIIAPLALAIIPFWGWLLGVLLGAILLGLEIYLIYKLDSGHRLGDVMADTSVMANDGNKMRVARASWFEAKKMV